MPSHNRSCASCAYREEGPAGQLFCHRFPAQIIALPQQTLTGMQIVPAAAFPSVAALAWCGEHKADIRPERMVTS